MNWNQKAMTVGECLVDWNANQPLPFRREVILAIYGTCAMRGRAVVDVSCDVVGGYRYHVYAVNAVAGMYSRNGEKLEWDIPAEAFFDIPVEEYPDVVNNHIPYDIGADSDEVGGDSDED